MPKAQQARRWAQGWLVPLLAPALLTVPCQTPPLLETALPGSCPGPDLQASSVLASSVSLHPFPVFLFCFEVTHCCTQGLFLTPCSGIFLQGSNQVSCAQGKCPALCILSPISLVLLNKNAYLNFLQAMLHLLAPIFTPASIVEAPGRPEGPADPLITLA